MKISPKESLADHRIDLSISELKPNEIYTCRFSLIDRTGAEWYSSYQFPSNSEGEVPVSRLLDHPLAFIRDMRSQSPLKFEQNGADPLEILLTVSQAGQHIGEKTLRRVYASDIEKIDIRNGEVYGYGFYPKKQKTDTVVVLFSGSAGGLGEGRASLYASQGITCFSIPYFKHEGLPQTLENIPLEYFPKAIELLREKHGAKKIVAIGTSRGGELVLLLGSLFPDLFNGIISIVPSSATYGGMPNLTKPAWIYDNIPFPIAPFPPNEMLMNNIDLSMPVALSPFMLRSIVEKEAEYKQAEIAVENIVCPIQLISASDDQMWPSTEYCHRIIARLKAHGKLDLCEHHDYMGAGHNITHPFIPSTCQYSYHPLQGIVFDNGGNSVQHFAATEDAWLKNLSFINSI